MFRCQKVTDGDNFSTVRRARMERQSRSR